MKLNESILYNLKEGKDEEQTCVLCGKKFVGWGNDAWPLADGYCCDDCNNNKVVPARIAQVYGINEADEIPDPEPEPEKKKLYAFKDALVKTLEGAGYSTKVNDLRDDDSMGTFTIIVGKDGKEIFLALVQPGSVYDNEVSEVAVGGDFDTEKVLVSPIHLDGWDEESGTPSGSTPVGSETYSVWKPIDETSPEEVLNLLDVSFEKANNVTECDKSLKESSLFTTEDIENRISAFCDIINTSEVIPSDDKVQEIQSGLQNILSLCKDLAEKYNVLIESINLKEDEVVEKKLPEDKFLNSDIDVYDLQGIVDVANKDNGTDYEVHMDKERALLQDVNGRYILSDYEAVRDFADGENDDVIEIYLSEKGKETKNDDGSITRTFSIVPKASIKVSPADIKKYCPVKKMKASEFFNKRDYNPRCENNFRGLMRNLNGEYLRESVKMNNLKEDENGYPYSENYYVVNEDDFNKLVDALGGAFEHGYVEITKDEFKELAKKHGFFEE